MYPTEVAQVVGICRGYAGRLLRELAAMNLVEQHKMPPNCTGAVPSLWTLVR